MKCCAKNIELVLCRACRHLLLSQFGSTAGNIFGQIVNVK